MATRRTLEVNGVGYRAAKEGHKLVLNIGYSHTGGSPRDRRHHHRGARAQPDRRFWRDKQKVGQFAAEIREKRPPEPYKGKGIKYADEVIRRKVGKTGAKK